VSITVPGPLILDLAEASSFLLGQAWQPIGDLVERKDSERHPEWWEEAFRDFDAMRALLETLLIAAQAAGGLHVPSEIDDAHLPSLTSALDEAIRVDSGILETGIHDGMDEYWVRVKRTGIENLKAFKRELLEREAVTA
jgi:hypothetical protein